MKQIAIIGECMIELNGKPFGVMQQTFGGDTLNAAVYLSRGAELNRAEDAVKISYVSALGSDAISDGMISRWQDEGIDTSLVLRDPTRTPGLYLIQVDELGERTFLYWRDQSPARYLLQHPDFANFKPSLAHADMLFLSGISLAILSEQDRVSMLTLVQELRQQGVEVGFDSNFRPALWPANGNQTVKAAYQVMYQLTDIALVTFDDEQLIWGDATPEATIARLHADGVGKVIVKLGAEGCLVSERAGTAPQQVATTPVSKVVDTTSAGDSFNGGFLSSYLAGGSLAEACQRGNAMAGIVIQHKGAIIPKAATDILKTEQ